MLHRSLRDDAPLAALQSRALHERWLEVSGMCEPETSVDTLAILHEADSISIRRAPRVAPHRGATITHCAHA
jgi:hypothetical protein